MGSGLGSVPVALVGYRGAGKSSVGAALAALTGADFCDLDRELEAVDSEGQPTGESAGELLARVGEPAFRALELAALARVLARAGPLGPLVVATGGGAVETPEGRALLAERTFAVWLRVPAAVLARRIAGDGTLRPPLAGRDAAAEVAHVLARREPLYRAVARVTVDAGDADAETVARRVRAAVGANPGRNGPARGRSL